MRSPAGIGGPPVAVIDLGSNSIRLVVYERLARAPLPRFNERRFCGLGRVLEATGRLAVEAIGPALRTLRRYTWLARASGCERVEILATAAVRRAEDGAAFVRAVEATTGECVRLVSGEEEARLSALGVRFGFHEPAGFVGDLGGGSVELAQLAPGEGPVSGTSLPIGALAVGELLRDDRSRAQARIQAVLEGFPELRGAARGQDLYLVGGSWRSIGRAHMALADTPLKVVHGLVLSPGEVIRLCRELAALDPRGHARVPGVSRRRLDLLPAGALLLERVVRLLEPERVVFSATGLREGRLFEWLEPEVRAQDPLLAGCADLGARDGRTPTIGPALAEWTAPLFEGEDAVAARLRTAVCLVADTAWREHPESRARDAFFTLAHYPLLGVDHVERAFLAYALFCRYEGRRDDPAIARILGLLDKPQRRRGEALGAALDLGFRLSGGLAQVLPACRIRREGGALVLEVEHPAVDPEDDAIKGRLETLVTALGLDRGEIRVPRPA